MSGLALCSNFMQNNLPRELPLCFLALFSMSSDKAPSQSPEAAVSEIANADIWIQRKTDLFADGSLRNFARTKSHQEAG